MISQLPAALQAQLGKLLGGGQPIFVGIPLAEQDAEGVVARLDDAAAEAAAIVIGRSNKRRTAQKSRR